MDRRSNRDADQIGWRVRQCLHGKPRCEVLAQDTQKLQTHALPIHIGYQAQSILAANEACLEQESRVGGEGWPLKG